MTTGRLQRPADADVLYLAVVPVYRQACIDELYRRNSSTVIFTGDKHLVNTVTTGIRESQFIRIKNIELLGGRLLLQVGGIRYALKSRALVVDLNPRCVTAWFLLLARRAFCRRTLVWGHLTSRRGGDSWTNLLRLAMRRLADGTILYDYRSVDLARSELKGAPIWVAANALYSARDLAALKPPPNSVREDVVFSGRLVDSKKPAQAIEAFAKSGISPNGSILHIVGDGPERTSLQRLARSLNVERNVTFHGAQFGLDVLHSIYSRCFASVSPGYAGLNITQSLGFGVPIMIPDGEHHSPEIELERTGGVHFFRGDSTDELAVLLRKRWTERTEFDYRSLSKMVAVSYTAEVMAGGLIAALRNELVSDASIDPAGALARRSASSSAVSNVMRAIYVRIAVRGKVKLGIRAKLGLGSRIWSAHGLSIGDYLHLGPGSVIECSGHVGNFVMIARNVSVVGARDHATDELGVPMLLSTWVGDRPLGPGDEVHIGDDVWIGAGAIVLGGSVIGDGAIVAAGALVRGEVPAFAIVAGVPARIVGTRFASEQQRLDHMKIVRDTCW